jgi:hypothetical protein
MLKRTPGVCAMAALATVLCVSPRIASAQENPPQTQTVFGTFRASPVNARQQTCTGRDGLYLEIRGRFEGDIKSSDPRLTGKLRFKSELALVNLTTGLGTFEGEFEIVDPRTGRQKAEGEFFSVVTEGSYNHAFALGRVTSAGPGRGDRFFARFHSTFDAALNVQGDFGTAGDTREPAVIQSGRCSAGRDDHGDRDR